MRSGDGCRVQCGRLDREGGAPGGGFEGRPCFWRLIEDTVTRFVRWLANVKYNSWSMKYHV